MKTLIQKIKDLKEENKVLKQDIKDLKEALANTEKAYEIKRDKLEKLRNEK